MAKTLQKAFEGPPSGDSPASFLQFHENVEVLSDKPAASLMIEHSSPWVVRDDINWRNEKLTALAATIWLSQRKKKKLAELTDEDFRSDHLSSIVESLGSSFGTEALREFNSKLGALGAMIRPENQASRGRVLIFSPHPDDDVICMGATMKKMTSAGYEVDVAYMVSGANAVKDLDVLNYLDLQNKEVSDIVGHFATSKGLDPESEKISIVRSIYQKSKGSLDEPVVRTIKAEIRRQEAFRASTRAGARAHFLNLPFYEEYGSARKAPLSQEDVDLVRNLLLKLQPDAIFVAGDTTDPNGTHAMCLDAFQEAFLNLKDSTAKSAQVFQYRGAWQEFTLEEADAIEPFTEEFLSEKIEMILE
ncbi:MAG: PIG-L family deacetylase, partial [Nitrososphaerales archaeon]